MAGLSRSANIEVTLNGRPLRVLPDFFDLEVLATFDSETQANLTTDSLRFVLQGYSQLKALIDAGSTGGPGVFEPVPIKIEAVSTLGQYTAFEGGVRLSEATVNETEGLIEAPLQESESLRTLDERLSGLTYLFLLEKGHITQADYVDVDYVVDKPDKVVEALIASITLYLMLRELADQVRTIANQIATGAGDAAGGALGPIGAAIYFAAALLLNIAYAAAILVIVLDLARNVINSFVQPLRTHKAIPLRTLLEKAVTWYGYGFNTSISLLDKLVYLPSNPVLDQDDGFRGLLQTPGTISRGIPNASDYGYSCAEIFQLCRNLFNARYQVVNGVVQFHPEESPYWTRQASYTIPPVLPGPYRFNTEDLRASRLLSFTVDQSDLWTLDEYRGTAYQVITEPITSTSNRSAIQGLEEVRFPVALGTRKNKLNGLEVAIAGLASVVDSVVRVFGGNSNLAGNIRNKVGVLRVGQNNHAIPKLLYFDEGRMPENHRDLFSAKVLWDNFHVVKSFVENNYNGQRKVWEEVTIPFGFADFVSLIQNSYCFTPDGKPAKINRLVWNMAKDTAVISYEERYIYTKNLREIKVEPD